MKDYLVNCSIDADLPDVFAGRHLIDGEWVAGDAQFERVSPSHGVVVSRSALGGSDETEAAIAAARRSFDAGVWSRISGRERACVLLRVADLIEEKLQTAGVAVVVEAEHSCMSIRGIRKPGSLTITSALRGSFKDNPASRAEIMSLINK